MNLNDEKIKDILVGENYVSKEDIARAEKSAKDNHTSIVDYLMSKNLVTKDLMGQAIAESFGLAYSDLNSNQPTTEQVLKIPEEIAKKFRVVLFHEDEKKVVVTTDNPIQDGLSSTLEALFVGKEVGLTYSLGVDINVSLNNYRKPLETRFSQIIEEKNRIAPEIIDQILIDALSFKASDIHFEPQSQDVVIRFRVDGVLQEAGRIPKQYYENVLNRIKVQSHLRIDEHQRAQDGSMRYEKDEMVVDIRTSIVPTVEGEKVVLRVLAAYIQGFTFGDLGLSEENQKILEEAANKPFGMILVTGPTGSGKTTTLYSLIKTLNHPDVNITTIEDPVEYKVVGINQIQVNTQTNLTFAQGLRSIVRQDPDIILVGEIRDEETAEIAVNAALTGHLLLSTFHANDAATAIPRLLDMKIEPFLLASTLEVIMAERLIRKICEGCRYSETVSSEEIGLPKNLTEKYFGKGEITLYKGKGCNACGGIGFNGRTAIFEFIKITQEMQELILKNPSTQEIWHLASKEGSKSLFEDGIEKVKAGATTLDELLRVAEIPVMKEK